MKTFRKQPQDHLDYDLDFSRWLYGDDEVVAVEVNAPAGIEVTQVSVEPNRVKLWIRGGAHGQMYKFSPLVFTRSRTKEVDFLIAVVDM